MLWDMITDSFAVNRRADRPEYRIGRMFYSYMRLQPQQANTAERKSGMPVSISRPTFRLVVICIGLATLWLVISTFILPLTTASNALLDRLEAIDQWLFVLPAGLLVYLLYQQRQSPAAPQADTLQAQVAYLMERITDGFVAFDKEARYTFVNPTAEVIIGKPASELLGKNVWEMFPDRVDGPFYHAYYRAEAEQRPVVMERCLDVSQRWIETRLYPSPDGISIYFHEITERKQIEAQQAQRFAQLEKNAQELEQQVLERTAQLHKINAELESFSYSISHDLRAPLRAVSGFADIIQRRHREALDPEGQRYVDHILNASARMGQLMDDLLKYSRLGRQAVGARPVSLREVLANSAEGVAARLREVGGTLNLPESMPKVLGTPALLDQIFDHLLDNAITYRSRDVPLHISIACQEQGEQVVVSVADNGIGIAPDYHAKIFNVFQRLHAEADYPGTGIGLAIVKKAVSLLEGDLWVESESGRGTTFFVKLVRAG